MAEWWWWLWPWAALDCSAIFSPLGCVVVAPYPTRALGPVKVWRPGPRTMSEAKYHGLAQTEDGSAGGPEPEPAPQPQPEPEARVEAVATKVDESVAPVAEVRAKVEDITTRTEGKIDQLAAGLPELKALLTKTPEPEPEPEPKPEPQ